MSDKIWQLIALGIKGGNVVSGTAVVERELQRGTVQLLLITEDAGRNTVKRFNELAEKAGVSLLRYGSKDEGGKITGRKSRAIFAITNAAMAQGIWKICGQESPDGEKEVIDND